PEMSAKVAFLERSVKPEEQKPRTALPPSAVIERNGKKVVYVVKDNRVVETAVTTGEKLGDMVEVLSGIKAGDRIALKPLDRLKSGSRVKIAE
ncbi:MAG TPA: hypothetical protein VN260_03970, partial [Dissulfurispiraceae bacterium]|nr:hypothetical protein [Dissulfurispiraceae bacterium]